MCGITGLISLDKKNIINNLYESLYHLQHRGQDAFGFSYMNDSKIEYIKEKGLLSNYSTNKNIITNVGIGHVRYPTKGLNTINEVQPLELNGEYHNISIVHNGQIWKTDMLKKYLDTHNIELDEEITSDSIILLYLLSYHLNKHEILTEKIIKEIILILYTILEGSFNCICLIEGYGLITFKDQFSIRPLILGKKDNNYVISSESVSITSIDYEIVNDIYNNELHIFNDDYHKISLGTNYHIKPCIFEWVYLAREESYLYGVNVYKSRYKMGEMIADRIKAQIKDVDYVIPVPDTSKPVALAISDILNIRYREAITKNRYVNRTFIMNTQEKRKSNIKRKLNIVKEYIEDKNIIIVDDSIVRGNTIKHIINLLKKYKAKDIYVVSACPEIVNENVYGIDIPTKEELLCNGKKKDQLIEELNIKDIFFQDINDLQKCICQFNPQITDFELTIFT